MGYDILSCGIIFCAGNPITDDSNRAAILSSGTLYFYFCLVFCFLFGSLSFRIFSESQLQVTISSTPSSQVSASPSKYRKSDSFAMIKVSSSDCLIAESPATTPTSSPDRSLLRASRGVSKVDRVVRKTEDTESQSTYSSACIDIPFWSTNEKIVEQLPLWLVFGLLYPLIIIASTILPTWWAGFSLSGLRSYAVVPFWLFFIVIY